MTCETTTPETLSDQEPESVDGGHYLGLLLPAAQKVREASAPDNTTTDDKPMTWDNTKHKKRDLSL